MIISPINALAALDRYAAEKGLTLETRNFLACLIRHRFARLNSHRDANRTMNARMGYAVIRTLAGRIIGHGC